MKSTGKVLFLTLLLLITVFGYSIVRAFYYLFMGVEIFDATVYNLSQWIIPYAAIGISLIIVTAIFPLIKIFEDFVVHIISFIAGIIFFIGFELLFEKIPALSAENLTDIYSAQAYLCITPVQQYYPGGVPKQFSPVIRLHFYIVSIIIIMIFIKVILDGFFTVENKKHLDKVHFVRLFSGVFLFAVCVIGTITDFFRNGSREFPLRSVILTVTFFIAQSVVTGLIAAGFFKKNYFISPIVSVFTCIIVYIGEYFVLGGYFYKLGTGAFFNGLFQQSDTVNSIPAPADLTVVLLSGIISFLLYFTIKPFKKVNLCYDFSRNLKMR